MSLFLHPSSLHPSFFFGFCGGWHAASVNEAEVDGSGDVFSFPTLPNEESLIGVSKPLPKQLWEAKKVQSLASRPKSCEVPGIK
ncbi:CREB-regulated transcription coactivator 3 isoform X1 [Lates japonicus]